MRSSHTQEYINCVVRKSVMVTSDLTLILVELINIKVGNCTYKFYYIMHSSLEVHMWIMNRTMSKICNLRVVFEVIMYIYR